jgi:hypothetical protein
MIRVESARVVGMAGSMRQLRERERERLTKRCCEAGGVESWVSVLLRL